MARGTRVQPGWNGSQTTTDRGAPTTRPLLPKVYTFRQPSLGLWETFLL